LGLREICKNVSHLQQIESSSNASSKILHEVNVVAMLVERLFCADWATLVMDVTDGTSTGT